MHPESKPHFSLSQPEYRRFIKKRGLLAVIDLERYSEILSNRFNESPVGDKSIEIALGCGQKAEFFLRELEIGVQLTNATLLSLNHIEYNHRFGISDHKLPRIASALWYINKLNLSVPVEITPNKARALRSQGNVEIKSLDAYTPGQIVERFITVINNNLQRL